jgi:hypothetical protein
MNNAGFTISQEEASDVSTMLATADTFVSDLSTWLVSAVSAQAEGTSVPAIPAIGTLVAGLSPTSIMTFVAHLAIKFALEYLRERFEGGSDTGELVSLLDSAIMAEENGEKISVLKRFCLSQQGTGGYLSNLWLLSQQPIEIMINRTGQIESVSFNSLID